MAFTVTDNGSDFATIARLYEGLLGREADGNGLAYWAELFDEGQLTLGQIATQFVRAREGAESFGAELTDAEFVAQAYDAFLGRAPDGVGGPFWESALESGLARGDLLANFAASTEAQMRTDVVADGPLEIPDFDLPTFLYGVASGDPDATSVVLWTHVSTDAAGPVEVTWEVATDAGFSDIVSSGTSVAGPDSDFTTKAIADGLEAGGEYFYRFTGPDGEISDVGKTKTLPEGPLDALTFAVFSCSRFERGFFNAYNEAVERGFDFALHTGDYIYETGNTGELASSIGRATDPAFEIVTPDDYATRYRQYTLDQDLQALRAEAPMIMMWDDHETTNNSWVTGAENHQPETEGDWDVRVDGALEAYHNWNPTREPEDDPREFARKFVFGDLLTLHVIETRLTNRDPELFLEEAIGARLALYATDPDAFAAEVAMFPDLVPAGLDPSDPAVLAALAADPAFLQGLAFTSVLFEAEFGDRTMIGAEQLADFEAVVAAGGTTWQVLASQTLMTEWELPLDATTNLPAYLDLATALITGAELTPEQEALLEAPTAPITFDSWDGFGQEREAILQALVENGANGIVLTGDSHNAWASNLATRDGTFAAVEFGGQAVTSDGVEGIVPSPADLVEEIFVQYSPELEYAQTANRGYMRVTFTPEDTTTEYVYLDNILSRDYDTFVDTFVVETGGMLEV
ncbi:MAG: alkaline phosphatase D family protein [Paracoccaceae bacterium]